MVPIRISAWVLALSTIDLGSSALADQVAETSDIALRAFELRLILGEHALGLLDLRVDLPRIERKQHIALIDPGAVFEMNLRRWWFRAAISARRSKSASPSRSNRHRPAPACARPLPVQPKPRAVAAGPCALAPPPIHDERVIKAASAAMPSTPATNHQITFFHSISRQPVHKGSGTARSSARDGDVLRLISNGLSQPRRSWYAR